VTFNGGFNGGFGPSSVSNVKKERVGEPRVVHRVIRLRRATTPSTVGYGLTPFGDNYGL
jgi:hypothetical protein